MKEELGFLRLIVTWAQILCFSLSIYKNPGFGLWPNYSQEFSRIQGSGLSAEEITKCNY